MIKAGIAARRFYARAQQITRTAPYWSHSHVDIFEGDQKIGEYLRNYGAYGEETFEPFEINGNWYALYSRDYTSTRIMSLPDCKDIGGEEPHSNGFCPVELFVPRFKKLTSTRRDTGAVQQYYLFEDAAEAFTDVSDKDGNYDRVIGPWQSLNTAFVAGCIWGDSSNWKLETIDLSSVESGKIHRSASFGDIELVDGRTIVDSLSIDGDVMENELIVTVISQKSHAMRLA